jgi:hypothetical protein
MKFLVISSLILLFGVFYATCDRLQEKFAWKQLEFDWPSESAKEQAIQSGQYIPINNLPVGIEVWRNKLFMTVPR